MSLYTAVPRPSPGTRSSDPGPAPRLLLRSRSDANLSLDETELAELPPSQERHSEAQTDSGGLPLGDDHVSVTSQLLLPTGYSSTLDLTSKHPDLHDESIDVFATSNRHRPSQESQTSAPLPYEADGEVGHPVGGQETASDSDRRSSESSEGSRSTLPPPYSPHLGETE